MFNLTLEELISSYHQSAGSNRFVNVVVAQHDQLVIYRAVGFRLFQFWIKSIDMEVTLKEYCKINPAKPLTSTFRVLGFN
jgi:hypothetical protein